MVNLNIIRKKRFFKMTVATLLTVAKFGTTNALVTILNQFSIFIAKKFVIGCIQLQIIGIHCKYTTIMIVKM